MRTLIVTTLLITALASPASAENNNNSAPQQQQGKVYVVPQGDSFRTESYTVNGKPVSKGQFVGHMEGQKEWIRDMNMRPDRVTLDDKGNPIPMTDEMRQQEIQKGEAQIDSMIQDINSRGGIECDSEQDMKKAIMQDKTMHEEFKRRHKAEREKTLWERGMLFEKPQSVKDAEKAAETAAEEEVAEPTLEPVTEKPAVTKSLVSFEQDNTQ